MRMLTAVLKDSQIQEFISENEDSAFDHLKHNFKIENIYNNIIENINVHINNEDLEASFESIKDFSRNYTLSILNEMGAGPIAGLALGAFGKTGQIGANVAVGAAHHGRNFVTGAHVSGGTAAANWFDRAALWSTGGTIGTAAGGTFAYIKDNVKGAQEIGKSAGEAMSGYEDPRDRILSLANEVAKSNPAVNTESKGTESGILGSIIEKLGLRKLWDETISPLFVEYPKLAPAIAIVGFLGIAYIAFHKKFGKK